MNIFRTLSIFLLPILSAGSATTQDDTGVFIDQVWSGHSVGFALLTAPPHQYVAYYNHERHMMVAQRDLGSTEWEKRRLPERIGWDSHNYITMAVDDAGHLHVSGNMHNHPLKYFRTEKPGDVSTLIKVEQMVGTEEGRVTYPQFFEGPDGALIFTYRDGGSGKGNQIYNRYDLESRTWSRLLDTPLVDGEGKRNAYFDGPHLGPDGLYHLVWVWRDTYDCATNHSLSYARSPDMVHWERSDGTPYEMPITFEKSEIVDPVPPGGGLINGNARLGFDSQKRPVISYHKHDAEGHTQIYNARLEDGAWRSVVASDWDYHWEFSGGGSIPFELNVRPVEVVGERLEQSYGHAKKGGGRWSLDPETLEVTGAVPRPEPVQPPEFRKVQSSFPGMGVRWRGDSGAAESPEHAWYIRWESLGPNRDKPREKPWPPPSKLEVYRFER